MRVLCIVAYRAERNLTQDKVYEVCKEDDKSYYIYDDNMEVKSFLKFRFEIFKEDKMENRIVRKLEDLDGLENGLGLKLDWDNEDETLDIIIDGRIRDVVGSELDFNYLKAMGFKFEYKPIRTVEEVIEEMKSKTDDVLKERNYDLYEVEFIKFTKHYKIRMAETVGAPVFVAGLAQKYADELNEIMRGGK